MSARREIALVVFDWAGTTIDFGCLAPAGAFVAAFAEIGIVVSQAEARRPMGLHKKDHLREMLRQPELAARWTQARGTDWTEADVEALYRRVTPMQVAAAGRYADLTPGLLDCVADLRQRGIAVAGSTGYFREAADVVLAAAGRQGFVPDFSICADDVPAGRPAPWMIYRAMEATGVYPPAAVIKVGDTTVDVQDGRNAGVWSAAVVDSSNEMGLSLADFRALTDDERETRRQAVRDTFQTAGADAMLDDLSDLPQLIDTLNEWLAEGQRP